MVYSGKRIGEMGRIVEELKDKGVAGISVIAQEDGFECISEVEVLLSRGARVPSAALELYHKYIKGGRK